MYRGEREREENTQLQLDMRISATDEVRYCRCRNSYQQEGTQNPQWIGRHPHRFHNRSFPCDR